MKGVIAASLLLDGILVAGLLWNREVVHAGGPIANGDVNGDGAIDISDAVYLLTHVFLAGPTPMAIECPPAPATGLPDTGQTRCYDQTGAEIPCEGAVCPGQDGLYATGCPWEGRFVDNGDGTVTDNCTRLMWQKNTADVKGDGQSTDRDYLRWCDGSRTARI